MCIPLAVALDGASLSANALSLMSTGTSESFHATRICSLLLFIFCFLFQYLKHEKSAFFKEKKILICDKFKFFTSN
jgi:hypothetical protein